MEKEGWRKWELRGNSDMKKAFIFTVKGVLTRLTSSVDVSDARPVIPLGRGDPSASPCFRTTPIAVDAILQSLSSSKFNGYAPSVGLPSTRRSIADYLSRDLPYELSLDDIYLTAGGKQAIGVVLTVLACPGANILLPRPGYPIYEAHAALNHIEVRHFDLLPEKGWEVDLDGVEALADDRTVAMVIINPGNPCGNVFTHEHLQKIAETAKKLGILVIADEAYGHLAFGHNPFVPMGVFGSVVPVLTVGSISKRWAVPGWRLGWIVTSDPTGILQKSAIGEYFKDYLSISSGPATFTQGAVPQILEKTTADFFLKTVNVLREAADICYEKLKDIPCIIFPHKPEGSMFAMVKLNLSLLEGIKDDVEFCVMLAKEESVIILPGSVVGMKNWLRITFAIEPSSLEDGLSRIKAFYLRHAKKQ